MKVSTAGHGRAKPVRVIIVENHQLVSETLGALLDGEPDLEVVAKAASVREAALLPAHLAPDIVVMDFHLGDGTGRDATLAMRAIYPDAKFVFLSRDTSDDAQLAAVEAGASAYLGKFGPASEVITAIRRVALGDSLITAPMVAALISRGHARAAVRESLSARELEVLRLMAAGVQTREVARRLGISYMTVRSHSRSISSKLGTSSMLNAVVMARELELVS